MRKGANEKERGRERKKEKGRASDGLADDESERNSNMISKGEWVMNGASENRAES